MFIHEKFFLVDAFEQYSLEMDDETYWSLLADVWQHQEQVGVCHEIFTDLFLSDRPQREKLMEDDERAALAQLPEQVTIYRGVTGDEDEGFSWTTDKRIAEWFASRAATTYTFAKNNPLVMTGTVNRKDIVAYLLEEKEVIVFPEYVYSTTSEPAKILEGEDLILKNYIKKEPAPTTID